MKRLSCKAQGGWGWRVMQHGHLTSPKAGKLFESSRRREPRSVSLSLLWGQAGHPTPTGGRGHRLQSPGAPHLPSLGCISGPGKGGLEGSRGGASAIPSIGRPVICSAYRT